MTDPIDAAMVAAFAPDGRLRASINLGNPFLANRDAAGEPVGVSVDLAREFGRRLGPTVELLAFERAADSVEAVRTDRADIGFFAIDPARSDGLLFTGPYVLIEGSYLVAESSALTENADVDQPGQRISVSAGSAYDLFLTREISRAEIVRLGGAAEAIAVLRAGDVEVTGGIRPMLAAEAQRSPGLRLLPGRFMVIQQAMGTPAGRGVPAQRLLAEFVETMKSSGFVADSLRRHGVDGATVAPASPPA